MLLTIDNLQTYVRQRSGVVRAVDGVSFTVDKGETVGVVGESGCGKTMMGMSIMRLLPEGGYHAGGSINFDGRDLLTLSDREIQDVRGNDIAVIFQDPMTSLNPTMTIGRQIAESVIRHRGETSAVAMDRAAEVLDLVGMPRPKERLHDYPFQLSGGLRQRVMIAMAIVCEPRLLIADEPTTALDVTIQRQILELLDDLKQRLGMAMILITHDMGVIAGRSDKVVVMYAGQVVEQAEIFDLFDHRRHPYTEALLSSIPQLDHSPRRPLYSIPGLPPDLTKEMVGCRFAPRCRSVQPSCRTMSPTLEGVEDGHLVACFFPVGAPVVVSASPARDQSDGGEVSATVDQESMSSHDDAPLLSLDQVSKEFDVSSGGVFGRKKGFLSAVENVSLTIAKGETFGLVGESGCGKSTLGRMITALDLPTKGQITIGRRDLASLGRRELRLARRDLQLMFQDPYASLDPRMRVGTILREPYAIQGLGSRDEQRKWIQELLAEVGLPANAVDRYPHEFSGGQRQRIGLARALALRPKLIVADEPVSALDVSVRSQILNLMKRLQRAHELTYLVISHDLSVVRYLADRIGVMYLGQIVEIGSADDIYERTVHPYTAGLLNSIPIPNPRIERAKHGAIVRGEIPSPINPPSGCRFRTRCMRASELCEHQVPALVSFDSGHLAACHHPLRESTEPGETTVVIRSTTHSEDR
jgi:peptide/nickel transport system ATP-binding protein